MIVDNEKRRVSAISKTRKLLSDLMVGETVCHILLVSLLINPIGSSAIPSVSSLKKTKPFVYHISRQIIHERLKYLVHDDVAENCNPALSILENYSSLIIIL